MKPDHRTHTDFWMLVAGTIGGLIMLGVAVYVLHDVLTSKQTIERVDTNVVRQEIDEQWYYTYDDGRTVCSWSDRIDIVCRPK